VLLLHFEIVHRFYRHYVCTVYIRFAVDETRTIMVEAEANLNEV
jgi:hypothetical protein